MRSFCCFPQIQVTRIRLRRECRPVMFICGDSAAATRNSLAIRTCTPCTYMVVVPNTCPQNDQKVGSLFLHPCKGPLEPPHTCVLFSKFQSAVRPYPTILLHSALSGGRSSQGCCAEDCCTTCLGPPKCSVRKPLALLPP